jgi:RNA polymerase sigma factor (sigma-70 family)
VDESIAAGNDPILTPDSYVRAYTARLMTKAISLDPRAPYEDALDRVQETLTRIIKKWPEKAEDIIEAGIAYPFTVLRHVIYDEWGSARNRHEKLGIAPDYDAPTELPLIDEIVVFSELQREIWGAVGTLDETQQEIIYLVYVEQYSVVGAGRILGLTSSRVHRYHQAALATLRSLMVNE